MLCPRIQHNVSGRAQTQTAQPYTSEASAPPSLLIETPNSVQKVKLLEMYEKLFLPVVWIMITGTSIYKALKKNMKLI